MSKIKYFAFIIFIIITFYGCNIVPKSVQYQREEEKLIGNTDIVNPIVEEIQVVLNNLGYDTDNKDGRLGQKTRDAIKEFQESIGLKSTGYIDKLTLQEIEDIRRGNEERELKDSYKIEVRSPYSGEESMPASKISISTRDIQRALKNAGFDPGTIDGRFGPRTRQAVKEFQKTKGLTPDGVVGSRTWAELGRYLKK